MIPVRTRIAASLLLLASLAGCGRDGGSKVSPADNAAGAGPAVAQPPAPLAGMTLHLDGFQPMKDDPSRQAEAHEYCRKIDDDFAQCAIFDGDAAQAKLIGVEYVISAKLFATLPRDERRYWHPRNGEILSGQLIAPGLPERADTELMRTMMNSYGKTWYLWQTDRSDQVPLGDPALAWSFTHDGEARTDLIEKRDRRLGATTIDRRRARTELVPLAQPQIGVDALRRRYSHETTDIPGVVDSESAEAARR